MTIIKKKHNFMKLSKKNIILIMKLVAVKKKFF